MTFTPLRKYIGRSFIICATRYGALDGKIGTVVAVKTVPWGTGRKQMLIVEIPGSEFSPALMLPDQFAKEVTLCTTATS
jgi:hypothetical protein